MKRKKERVGDCGIYYLFCHSLLPSFTWGPTSFHRIFNIGGQGVDVRELVSAAFEFFPDYYRKLGLDVVY